MWVATDAGHAGQLEAYRLRGALAGPLRVQLEAGALCERHEEAAEAAVDMQRHAAFERELRELRDRVDRAVREARRAAHYLRANQITSRVELETE